MKYLRLLIMVVSLSLIGAGVGLVHVPAALVVVGSLLWLDLTVRALLAQLKGAK